MSVDKIMVGMSGGVDSSVAAALVCEQGSAAVGATLRLYDKDCAAEHCPSRDAEDARNVCQRLSIPHHVLDFRDTFSKKVIDSFISEYENGGTPNPCIECNRYIKFGEMLTAAEKLGCTGLATGHYACVKRDGNGRYLLIRPNDSSKEQTYVLYSLSQHQLSRTVFPLGGLSKPQVREIAAAYGFENAAKADSQDICFVPDGDYAGFIERYCGSDSPHGDFVDEAGNVLGEHCGMIRYTNGQRKGLGIALGRPVFVIGKDTVTNRVVLGDEDRLFFRRVLVEKLNFIPFDTLNGDMRVTAKLRYRHTEQPATLHPIDNGQLIIEFDEPQRAPSRGQAAVFYDGECVVGGGTILKGTD